MHLSFLLLLLKCASGALLCEFTYGLWFQPAQSGAYTDCPRICSSVTNPLDGQPGSFATPRTTDISAMASILGICANTTPYTPSVWIAGTSRFITITQFFVTQTQCQYIVKSTVSPFGTVSAFLTCVSRQQCLCGWASTTTLVNTLTTTVTVISATQSFTTTASVTVTTTATLTRSSVSLVVKTITALTTNVSVSTSRTTRTITSSTLLTLSQTTTTSTTTTLQEISTSLYTTTLSTLLLTTSSSFSTTTFTLVTCPS